MNEYNNFLDEIGPEKIIQIYIPGISLRAVVVIDNIARGPAIGGTRMAPDVSVEECVRLARAMTMKNAIADLPHGGAKSVIYGASSISPREKENQIRAFASSINELNDYIPGPDMGTDEESMAWIEDEIGRAVGLPRAIGGIPLDEIGATGFGLAIAAEAAQNYSDVTLNGAKIAVQGFGAVGRHAARFLVDRGAVLVGASDSQSTIYDPNGLDIVALSSHKLSGSNLAEFPNGKKLVRDGIISVDCDIWVPAARPDIITSDNVDELKCRVVLQGANIPVTMDAEQRLFERGILTIPDFVANAGGVICASVEYHGGTQTVAFEMIEEKIRKTVDEVLRKAEIENILPRESAVNIAKSRINAAMSFRRWV